MTAHNNTNSQPKSLLIVGGGTAGWMAANLILQAWPDTQVSLIESDDIGIIGVGEGATPYLKTFFKRLNISESEWMPACDATYKVGINFEGWSGLTEYPSYFHPFFSVLDKPIAEMFFHNCGARRRGAVAHTCPDDFFITPALARQGKSPVIKREQGQEPKQAAQGEIDYAYHFDSGKLGQFLKSKAKERGLRHVIDKVVDVATHPSGDISHVSTEKSGDISADFFIDCTGFRARLIHQTLKQDYVSYADNLLNNAAVAIQTPKFPTESQEVQTRSIALNHGWVWKIPLSSRNGNGYVYSDNHISAFEAEAELRQNLGIGYNADVAVKHLSMRIGRLSKHWHKNCLAVGLSQGFIEPLEATALMLTQLTLDQFIASIEGNASSLNKQRRDFNQQLNTMFDGVRDYIVAHYQLSQRTDTEYWRDNQFNTPEPEILQAIKQAWLQGGDVEKVLSEYASRLVYLRPSWYCIFAGMGIFPKSSRESSQIAQVTQARQYTKSVLSTYFN